MMAYDWERAMSWMYLGASLILVEHVYADC